MNNLEQQLLTSVSTNSTPNDNTNTNTNTNKSIDNRVHAAVDTSINFKT
jgi:hypothetical protein